MELIELVAPIRRWWWLILASTLIAAGASYYVGSQQPDVYQARATLMIGQAIENPNPSGSEFWLSQQLAQTYAEVAERQPVGELTKEALDLQFLPEVIVQAVPDTQLIEIRVNDTSPARAAAVAEEFANQMVLRSPTNADAKDAARETFIQTQLDELETTITATGDEIQEKQDALVGAFSAQQIEQLQGEIAALQTKQTTLQANYANLLANTNRGAINSMTIIGHAEVPSTPVGPGIGASVVAAGAVGLVLATAAAYLLEYLDDSIVSPDDIARVTEAPTLAGIARIEEDDEGGRLIALSEPRAPTTEAYRVLRTGIQFSSVDNPDQARLMITSANPSEGKSLTVANLAIVMAQAGLNVLVVDADLRRPVQHKAFRMPQKGGLTNLLLELDLSASDDEILAAMKRAIQPTQVEGLHLLTSGPIPPNPSELLGSAKMEMTISTLARQYDYLVIDSPPVLAVTDAAVLSRRVDGVLLVVDAGRTRRGHLRQSLQQLEAANAHVIGLVLNRMSPRSDGYYTYYYYRHAYYLDESAKQDLDEAPTNGRGRSARKRLRIRDN
jgi:succinoglycan biosynthesis transport protein ExoP